MKVCLSSHRPSGRRSCKENDAPPPPPMAMAMAMAKAKENAVSNLLLLQQQHQHQHQRSFATREPLRPLTQQTRDEHHHHHHPHNTLSALSSSSRKLNRSNSNSSRRLRAADDFSHSQLFLESPTPSYSSHVWDDPDCESNTPASAWSTLANRALLCRPLPLDVGRCVCYITRERHDGAIGYALYTDEGHGRQDRKLAVAFHKRRAGKSEFVVFSLGLELNGKSGAVLGRVQANLVGSRYLIWDDIEPSSSQRSSLPPLLGVVMFQPTVTTLTGSFRTICVSLPKYQSTQIVPSTYRETSFAPDWEENGRNAYQLYSRKPHYNKVTRRYELDFRDRTKKSSKIMTSARNLQLVMNENGKQTILMLAKIGKSRFLLEYRFPLTAYQAFSIALASMDSKLCCSL